jgi:hypothetical protein
VLFFKATASDLTILLVHVDCTIISTTLKLVNWSKKVISEHVEITDLGEIHWLLGIEVKRNRLKGTISLSQGSYIDSSICLFSLEDWKLLSIPMDPSIQLLSEHSPKSTAEIA